jgi:hypothetical protein
MGVAPAIVRVCPESARARGTVPILLYEVSQETLWRAKWGQSPALSGQTRTGVYGSNLHRGRLLLPLVGPVGWL